MNRAILLLLRRFVTNRFFGFRCSAIGFVSGRTRPQPSDNTAHATRASPRSLGSCRSIVCTRITGHPNWSVAARRAAAVGQVR